MKRRSKILVAEDQPNIRETIVKHIEKEKELRVVADVADGFELVKAYRRYKPDMIIVDINLPRQSGLEAVKEIRKSDQEVKVLVVTMYEDINLVKEAVIDVGVQGYLFKMTKIENIIASVHTILKGYTVFDDDVSKALRKLNNEFYYRYADRYSIADDLTRREYQILKMIASGKTSEQIAEELKISRYTVDNHRRRMLHKLGFNNTTALVQYANARGLI